MPAAIVIGGGLAGLAATAALGQAGYTVDLLEARPFLGGRATSYTLPDQETIDNCQHILLRCCVNLLDFYGRLGVRERIRFHRAITFLEPGGRASRLTAGWLPAPLHLAASFARLRFLGLADKVAVAQALLAIRRGAERTDLDRISMLDWLQARRQTPRAIGRFWRPVLVSAVNEDLDRMSALHGFQVFRLGFLAQPNAYEMGIPAVPLAELYSSKVWEALPGVRIHHRALVETLELDGELVACAMLANGSRMEADFYISAVPFERIEGIAPWLNLDLSGFVHSSITGVHLWFDRTVTNLPHAALLDRTIQWFFNNHGGRYLQLVVSASKGLVEMPRGDVIDLAVRELAEFLPAVREARVEKAHVVKELRATFSPLPGLEQQRPRSRTALGNFFLAGDWTRSGWPATMEGAVRSGYLAAEAVTAAAGRPSGFLLPDIA
jgi:zeta-carotene desaturase